MGVFALIGIIIGIYGYREESALICFLGLMIFGIGVAADQNGY